METRRFSLSVMLMAVACVACERQPPQIDETLRPVRYQRVSLGRLDQSRAYSGVAKARLETNVSFKVAGTLIARPVAVGDNVARGALIARLEAQEYQVPVQEAEAGLAQAVAELRNVEAAYERTRGLYENRNASRSELDAARARAESAEAQVRAARQQLEAAELRLSYTRLYSPDECTVAEDHVEVNQNVDAGQPIVRLNCGDCPEVTVSVAETFIAQVRQSDSVDVRFNALPDQTLAATVVEVGVASGSAGTAYPVTVALREGCDTVRSGMAADVLFPVLAETTAGEFIVPSVAVGEDAAGRFVFVLEPDAADRWFARRRSVEVGRLIRNGLVVRTGLDEGELIATAGVRRIVDGQQVTLLAETD